MSFANPAGWLFLLAWIPIIGLHVLRPRRREHVVSSRLLWHDETVGVTAATPWQRLRITLPLLLQLLIVALLAAALADPRREVDAGLANHTVVVVDASASMGATDGGSTRLDQAISVATSLWDERPDGGRMSVVVAGAAPRVLTVATTDEAAYLQAVRSIDSGDGPADLLDAMALADGLEGADETIGIVLVSDGGHSDAEIAALPDGVTHRLVGVDDVNRAITSFTSRLVDGDRVVSTVVEVTGGPATTATLRLDVDGRTEAIEELMLDPAAPTIVETVVPDGERIVARLGGDDQLAIDDTAYLTTRTRADIAVAVDGEDTFLTALFDALAGVTVVDPSEQLPDVSVFVGTEVPADLARPFLAVATPGGVEGITVSGSVEAPIPTLVATTDPLLAGLDLSALRIVEAQRIDAPAAEVLVAAEGAPLIVRGRRAGTPFVYLTFELGQSNLPLDVSFPVLGDRVLAELADANSVPVSLEVGRPLVLPPAVDATVTDPSGASVVVPPGSGAVLVDRPGFWTVESADAAPRTVAVSLPVSESDLTPLPVPPTEPRERRAGERSPTAVTSLRWISLAAALAIAAAEWWLARRQHGVSRRQWRLANIARAVALAAALVGLFGVTVARPADGIVTVFVLDRSDSVGDVGRQQGLAAIDAAVAAAPEDARHAVVVVGDGARVERLLADSATGSGLQTVVIDPGQTDLAAGLRLAGAVTPDDARRRVVVVSDGRATTGDAVREAAALSDRQVQIDYVPLAASLGADASVLQVSAPRSAEQGQNVTISASVSSSAGQTALVSLRRDGEIVETVTAELAAGTTIVEFTDVASEGGLVAYDVVVDVALDARPQNDVGRVTVDVDGPAGVLVVEGAPGVAGDLVAGLRAGGLDVDSVPVVDIPTLELLAGYDSVVLVDVDADDLGEAEMTAIVSATRDLGVGLLTIGGTQSFGMGGYRDTALESVLPVVSDVLDPRRRRTVAEVLAIDTSESMGECHCAEGFMGTGRTPGGVNKTDIARTGAARAIDALHADDEIGVLGIDTDAEWLIDLQRVPSDDVVREGLARITPRGDTSLATTLSTAAAALRESNAGLKHIILFSDGFTQPGELERLTAEAGELFAEGITTSVVATGEGAARELEPIAVAGGGRFYPGRDLSRIPEILVEESVIASRNFINEGEFLPVRTGLTAATEGLDASPPLLGFVATMAQPSARTLLAIGDEDDPLLATWQAGLGRSTAWTSDAGIRWGQSWVSWDGYVDFWSAVVRDTFPLTDSGAMRTTVDGDELRIVADRPEGTTGPATATITDPDGLPVEVRLTERPDGRLEGSARLDQVGGHAVSVRVDDPDGPVAVGTDVASLSYSSEYRAGSVDAGLLEQLTELSGGRGAIDPADAFAAADLVPGERDVTLGGWAVVIAALAWLLAAVLSRLWLFGDRSNVTTAADTRRRSRQLPLRRSSSSGAGPSASGAPAGASPASSDGAASKGSEAPPPPPPTPEVPPPPPAEPAAPTTMDELLRRKRDRS